ncbi:aryl-alcohol-oxidase from pleurotus Eryingii [Mycena maculata]|uniref:Aryl-alcohol-oxidase from pleurotus Eryingii n=1 Tax=Mycena maculata TaxID=230809 RepID=A0AAD7IH57_9AGAR|nr:aryl-alcohol-oxidase from pleurotus Eryingii [Mycena maculata]
MASPVLFALIISLVHISLGSIFTAPEQVSTSKKYDFIIVGAGTAGSVIAARVSEDPSVNVLVIEAGVADNGADSELIYIPLLAGEGVGTIFDWNYTTTAQSGFNGRALDFPRGFVMGGSSAINGMIYSRGSSDEYDRLAKMSGDSGWSWDSLEEYRLMNEKHSPPWNNRSNVGEYDPRVHGYGPLLTGLTPTVFETDKRVIANTAAYPEQYPFTLDLNSGNGLGFGWLETSVGNGSRSTSASTYLHPALNSRSNLDILLHTQATRLVSTSGKATFRKVQVAQSATTTEYSFTATKEVILCAGSVGTPQLLMLSGIGPTAQLKNVGITPVLNLPDVGNNLQDQSILALQWEVNGTTLSSLLRNATAVDASLEQWSINKTGPAAGNMIVNTIGFLRLPSNSTLLAAGDPAAGPNSAHIQLSFLETFYPNPGQVSPSTGSWMSATVVVQSPTSRGFLNLTSSSAFVHPTINPAYYTTAFDIGAAIEGVKMLRDFLATPVWDGYIIAPYSAVAVLETDAEIETYIRSFANTLDHPTSTAKISKTTDNFGVVGPELLVKGATGLRIVDASILPAAVAGFPQAEVYIIAERAAGLIKSAWSLS